MVPRLQTVRAKLTLLVALPALITLITLPAVGWLLHQQLMDEVDDRVLDANHSLQVELADDIADVTLAAHVLANDQRTTTALENGDAQTAQLLAQEIVATYPNVDVLLLDAGGQVLASVGCTRAAGAPIKLKIEPKATQSEMVLDHGCDNNPSSPPAIAIGVAMPEVQGVPIGGVMVCLPIDKDYLTNARDKLGVELARVDEAADSQLADSTAKFPHHDVPKGETRIVSEGNSTWALATLSPQQGTPAAAAGMHFAAALDVTDISRLVRLNLLRSLLVVLIPAAVALFFGSRLASIMSGALRKVNLALKKVEQLDYVHVEPVRTGDELEDLASGFNSMVDGLKERDKLRTTFGKYVTMAVAEHLMKGKVQLGGEVLSVTILFTDIRSFTSISEKMNAQALVSLLNEYFTDMVGIVMDEDGVVDKYIGDAIMAVFGAPVPKPDDAICAVRAAVRMRKALVLLNERLGQRGMPALHTGIGIHTGEVVAGNIGSEDRMEYTVIGDAVNLASRLEGSTKEVHVDILISDATYELVKDHVRARPVREITVKGRVQPVMTYEVLGMTGDLPRLEPPLVARHDKSKPPLVAEQPAQRERVII